MFEWPLAIRTKRIHLISDHFPHWTVIRNMTEALSQVAPTSGDETEGDVDEADN